MDVYDNFGHTALESLVYVVDRLYAKFDVANVTLDVFVNIGHDAFESATYVAFRVTAALLAYEAEDAVVFRLVSVNVDALITMLEVA